MNYDFWLFFLAGFAGTAALDMGLYLFWPKWREWRENLIRSWRKF